MKEVEIKNKWEDITIYEYQSIMEIIENPDLSLEAKQNELMTVVTDLPYEDILRLQVVEYKKILNNMEFLKKPIPSKHIGKTIIINNQKFNVITKLSDILAGQYLELQYLMKGENDYDNIHKIAALFILPADQKYGDFNMVEHQEFLKLNLDIVSAYVVFFYLHNLSKKLFIAFHKYLTKEKKMMMKEVKMKNKISKMNMKVHSQDNGPVSF